jgi:hypothetical protein
MHEIKSFSIFQTAKVVGVLYGISFLLMAIVELLVIEVVRHTMVVNHGMVVSPASGHPGGNSPFVFMFVVVPIFGTIFSFIGVAFGCWLYNVLVPHIGGIAFELNPSARTNGPSN